MIYIKSDDEIQVMRECGTLLALMYDYLEPYVQPGISGLELDKLAENFLLKNNAVPEQKGYKGFPSTLCVSINEQVIHGIPSKRKLKEGDIVGLDCTISLKGLMTDSARTFAVGTIGKKEKLLLERTEKALYLGIDTVHSGMRVNEIGRVIEEYIKSFEYGIVRDFCGHGVGYDIHEEPTVLNYYSSRYRQRLKENMVITIEPMINLGRDDVRVLSDDWTVETIDKQPSCHFEHTIAVTEKGCEILTVK
ncbi:MAG: type I methionyl aminopeptidase [Spirochaetaceae bacterium]|nr:type I methionyl aminopeptidase [Spirochaetaceae bacterium]